MRRFIFGVMALACMVSRAWAVDFGWQTLSGGGIVYIVQVEPDLIDSFRRELRIVFEHIANPLVLNRRAPTSPNEIGLRQANEQIPKRGGIEDVRIVDRYDRFHLQYPIPISWASAVS